jgi:putative membrane protein
VIDYQSLPAINATLNASAAVLLVTGYVQIRRRNIRAHQACMWSALGLSTLFLISYVTYHYLKQQATGEATGLVRTIYRFILLTHVVLAAAVVPLAFVTIWRGVRNRLDRHVRIARWTLPIWLYVSVTGVVVYLMLYHWYAPTPA